MLNIGNYKLPSNILLAPMAGVTDLPFRLICRKYGAKFAFLEMIDCNSIIYKKKKENDIIMTTSKDRPIAAQLVGPDPEMMLTAAKKLIDLLDIKFLDINAACPVPKMMKKKAGAYMIKDPGNLYRILDLLSSKLDIPITVKLRSGFHDVDHKWIKEIAKDCESNGAAAIFIHGRTQKQGYAGEIDYEAIKQVKSAVKIPVFGSGNVFDIKMADKMIKSTGVDGLLVARGAYGNPWLLKDIESYIKSGKMPKAHTPEEKLKAAKEHLSFIEKYRTMPAQSKVGYMRKVAQWYTKEFSHACHLRRIMNNAKSKGEILAVLDRAPEIIEKAVAFHEAS
jgi:tRNA-dihydrouridine synthase B